MDSTIEYIAELR